MPRPSASPALRVLRTLRTGSRMTLRRHKDFLALAGALQKIAGYRGLLAVRASPFPWLAAYDLALIDCYLHHGDGVTLIQEAVGQGCEMPLIIFTGQDNRELDQAALEAGAVDYLIKGDFNTDGLERAIRYALAHKQAENELKHLNQQHQRLAERDALTGLANRHYFDTIFPQVLERAKRNEISVALMFLDLDGFKTINDTYGHDVGDTLLQQASARLTETLRRTDYIFRFGGDEFTVIIEGNLDPRRVATVARKITFAFEQAFTIHQLQIVCGVSVGIATSFRCGMDTKTLIKCADQAMYAAKRSETLTYQFFTPELNQVTCQSLLHDELIRDLLRQEQISIHYEPIVALETMQVVGLEVVPYAMDKQGTKISYMDLTQFAQVAGLSEELGERIYRQVVTDCQDFLHQSTLKLVLPLPDLFFQRAELFTHVLSLVSDLSLAKQPLHFACSQAALMLDPDYSIEQLRIAKDAHCVCLLNDCGAQDIVLRYLPMLSLAGWRLAPDLVDALPQSTIMEAIVKSILDMGRHLQQVVYMPAIANAAQKDWACAHGVTMGQGRACAAMMSAQALPQLLE